MSGTSNVTCPLHDIPESLLILTLSNNHSITENPYTIIQFRHCYIMINHKNCHFFWKIFSELGTLHSSIILQIAYMSCISLFGTISKLENNDDCPVSQWSMESPENIVNKGSMIRRHAGISESESVIIPLLVMIVSLL